MDRPVILVDLDNVVYDFVQAMAIWLDKNGALDLDPFIYEPDPMYGSQRIVGEVDQVSAAMMRYSQWSIWDDWNIPKGEFIRWWRLGIEAGEIYGQGPLIPMAREALWKLSDADWDIFLATSRLTKFGAYDKIVGNTASWLYKNNIPYRSLAVTDKKTSIIADVIVDDRADNMNLKVHDKCILFPAPHNLAEQVPYSQITNQFCLSWDEIVEMLLG